MLRPLALATVVLTVGATSAFAAAQSFTENFTTTAYKDTAFTTADWDTTAAELKLPGLPMLIGNYSAPSAIRVIVDGDHAFVADGFSVRILDVSTPSEPTLLGTYVNGTDTIRELVADGDYLHVAADNGYLILDISDPTTPVLLGSVAMSNARGLSVAGDHAYLGDGPDGFRAVDISDPTTPTIVGTYDTPGFARAVAVAGDMAFLADQSSFLVLDITDPTSPAPVGSLAMSSARNLFASGDVVYVADVGDNTLRCVDVSDPTAPALLATVNLGSIPQSIFVDGDRAYVGFQTAGVHIYDVTDPSSPALLSTLTPSNAALGIHVDGEYLYIAGFTLDVFRVFAPDVPTPVGAYNTTGTAHSVKVVGDLAFLADGTSGLQVLDISNPSTPALLGTCDTPGFAVAVDVAGDLAFVADVSSGLQVIDISDPSSPTVVGSYSSSFNAMGVAAAGDIALVTADTGLLVFDIEDPTTPALLGSVGLGGSAASVAIAGDHAFVSRFDVLKVVDISDPTSPFVVSTFNAGSYGNDVAVAGDLAFLVGIDGLLVLDITDPASPALVATNSEVGNGTAIQVRGDLAFVTRDDEDSTGFVVTDISDPANPTRVERYDTPDIATDVTVAGVHAYVTDRDDGVRVVRVLEDEADSRANAARSLSVAMPPGPMLGARLTSVEAGAITWEIGANVALNGWTEVTPGGDWTLFSWPASDLFWRSTLHWTGLNPTASSVTLEWLLEQGPIVSVADVPDDQGGWVRVNFTRSGYDFASEDSLPVTGYQIYQRVDEARLAGRVLEEGSVSTTADLIDSPLAAFTPGSVRTLDDRRFVLGGEVLGGSFPPGIWEAVAWVAATQSDTYQARVSTTGDSTSSGVEWSVYLTTTHTTTPSIWFASEPDSGYSVDNIAPAAPLGLLAVAAPGSVLLTWDASAESDFHYYSVYRGTDPGFVPGTPIGYATSESYVDADLPGPDHYYYKVTATDYAGNESTPSDPSDLATDVAAGVDPTPAGFFLGEASPNPFRPLTEIRYGIPAGADPARVTLSVFDPGGRRVKTLVDRERGPGTYRVTWNGTDERGNPVASGIYFYRISCGDRERTRRMVLAK